MNCRALIIAAGAAVIFAGCASAPDRVRREMQAYTDKRQYDAARAVKAKHNPGGIPQTDEEAVKEEMIRDVVNPAEIKDITSRLQSQVAGFVRESKFDAARDVVWSPIPDRVPEVDEAVQKLKDKLLREEINRTQFIKVTNDMTRAVSAAVAANDFKGARKILNGVKPVRLHSGDVEDAMVAVAKALAQVKAPQDETGKALAAARDFLAEIFADNELTIYSVGPGGDFKPDDSAYRKKLEAFGDTLKRQGVKDSSREKAISTIDEIVMPALRSLWRPQESYDLAPPVAIGTSKLNELIDEAKGNLYTNVVVPAQIAYRARTLREKVVPLVVAGSLEQARAAIHAFGVTGYPEVDDPVFAVKLGLLNARVNIAEWDVRRKALAGGVMSALAGGDLDKAAAVIAADVPVPAYGTQVDTALRVAASEAVKQGRDEGGAGQVVVTAQRNLCSAVASRPDSEREERIMDAYGSEVASILVEKFGEGPGADWSAVSNALVNAAAWLVAGDMSREDANAFVKEVLVGFQALPGTMGERGPSALTTEQLNDMLSDLKAELSATVAAAISLKMAAASLVAESASMPADELAQRLERLKKQAAEKVSPEFAETLIAENSAEAERFRTLALEMAERAASAVDFDARINGFVAAVSERTEPDVNRILGDGARILRLRRAGAHIGRDDATSLLAAAIYLGYDDVAALAIALDADINGAAAKDALRRPVILLAMQFGFKGRAATTLKDANRDARDANGDGALHYAVRGANGTALVDLLRAGIDARLPGANGATPIILAADLGYAGFVQALVPFSNLEQVDDGGFTALLRAVQNGRLDIVRNLVAAGADLAAKTKDGDGALELAAMANASELLAWLLDEKKVEPTPRVVSQLVIAGNVPTLQVMVAHGARLLDAHLAAAVKLGDFPMVKYLVNQGMDVNADVVKNICRELKGSRSPTNDGSYYGPDGGSVLDFLREQGQRL